MAQTKNGALKQAASRYGITVDELIKYRASGMMRCQLCNEWKSRCEFPKNSGPKYTVSGRCLECARAMYVHRERTSPSWMKGRKHTDESKKMMSVAHAGSNNHRWKGGVSQKKNRDPNSILARRAINHSIESGIIPRPASLDCKDCGSQAAEYHHDKGYEKQHWMDVIPLCIACHHKRHTRCREQK